MYGVTQGSPRTPNGLFRLLCSCFLSHAVLMPGGRFCMRRHVTRETMRKKPAKAETHETTKNDTLFLHPPWRTRRHSLTRVSFRGLLLFVAAITRRT